MSKHAILSRTLFIALFALLTISAFLSRPLWANIPEGFKVSPQPNQILTEEKPVIKIRYPKDLEMDFSIVRLWINDAEVSGNCLRTPRYVSYQPFVDMPSGEVKVRFEGKAATAKNKKDIIKLEWHFELQKPQAIKSITHNANHDMGYMEDIVVQAESVPGAIAWFSIEDIVDEVSMDESVPGKYEGRYRVKINDNKLKAHVTVHVKAGGHQYDRTLDNPICISGGMFTITIYEPQQNDLVPLSFKIKGHTRPNAIIYMQPKIGMGESMGTQVNDRNKASFGSIPYYADENGDFVIEYGFPIMLPNMQAMLMFSAVDPEGNKSLPKQLWVKFKQPESQRSQVRKSGARPSSEQPQEAKKTQ
ncbi:MAG: hypothetical protein Q4F00_04455 [bacterium]|nr:hypothetical protein [bacterium]